MAKTKEPGTPKAKPTGPTEVVVRYDLADLPTAFHKAGLAGLILLIDSLKARRLLTPDGAKYEPSATGATVTFTENLVGKLFDDLYDAEPGKVKEKKPGSRKKNVEREEAEKKPKEPPPTPKLTALRDMLPDGDELWVKLWRDMIFQVPRSQPATWKPYKDRIAGRTYRLKDRDPWDDLQRFHAARQNDRVCTGKLSGSLLLGIQEDNPEMVPCQGRLEQNLLLHFWPLAILLFTPQQLKVKKENGNLQVATEYVGYALAVPDISNLEAFVRDYPKLLAALSIEPRGFRPAQSVIDLPAEGALAFLEDLAVLTGLEVETGELRFSISGVEYLHLFKDKRNVKLMAAGRVSPNRRLLAGYRAIVCPKDESTRYRNPLFRRGLLVALLDDLPWYRPFGRAFSSFEDGVFLRRVRGGDEKGPPQFATDAAKKLRHESRLFTRSLERLSDMPDTPRPTAPLPVLVERVIRAYLLGRAKAKCGLDRKTKLKTLTDSQRKDVYAHKAKVAQETFLAARSRRDADFVGYFSSVICSAGTYFDRDSPDFAAFAAALIDPNQTDTIKTLTLLALSANS